MEIRESGAGFEVIGAAYYEVFPTRFGALLAAFCLAARRAKFSGRTVAVRVPAAWGGHGGNHPRSRGKDPRRRRASFRNAGGCIGAQGRIGSGRHGQVIGWPPIPSAAFRFQFGSDAWKNRSVKATVMASPGVEQPRVRMDANR